MAANIVWTQRNQETMDIVMAAFPFGSPGREGIVMSFFSEERRDLALARYNTMVEEEILDAGAQFFQNGEAIAVNQNNPPQVEVNDQPLPQNGGVWSMEEKIRFVRGLYALGRDWNGISRFYVRSRDRGQVRGHSLNRTYEDFLNNMQ